MKWEWGPASHNDLLPSLLWQVELIKGGSKSENTKMHRNTRLDKEPNLLLGGKQATKK